MSRTPRPRGILRYDKPPLSLDQLSGRLVERGLELPDLDRARRYLRHIGYYRLSPYAIPFQKGRPDHLFRDGATFNDVLGLYVFDRALRLLVMDLPDDPKVAWIAASNPLPDRSRKRLYPVLISPQSVLDTVSPRSSWARRLHALLSDRPRMTLSGMGVSEDWADDTFWSRHMA